MEMDLGRVIVENIPETMEVEAVVEVVANFMPHVNAMLSETITSSLARLTVSGFAATIGFFAAKQGYRLYSQNRDGKVDGYKANAVGTAGFVVGWFTGHFASSIIIK